MLYGEPIEKGHIKLASRTRPPLQGEYTLTATQELGKNPKLDQSKIKDAHFSFICGAEALKLSPDDIYSVYPPKDSYGKFERLLPHIVLRRRTLPWERTFSAKQGAPWITLLLFDETEGVVVKSSTQKEAFDPPGPGVYCPVKAVAPDDPCIILDVPSKLFCDICPDLEELPLMAHSRCVSRADKVTEADKVDEWLSVMVANRTPFSNTSDIGVKNSAFLVTVEAFTDFFLDPALRQEISQGTKYNTVRIPVLYTWDFFSKTESFDFKTVFENLDAGVLMPPLAHQHREETQRLLARGFIPLNHSLRDGGRTVSWYAGPFAPYKPPAADKATQLFADGRLIYEPEMGMFDVSYSVAFNLGRLLALQETSYAAALDRWRQANKLEATLRLNSRMIAGRLAVYDNTGKSRDISAERLETLMDETVAELVSALMNGGAADGTKLGG